MGGGNIDPEADLKVVRRLKALLLMGPALDANYRTAADTAMEQEKLTRP